MSCHSGTAADGGEPPRDNPVGAALSVAPSRTLGPDSAEHSVGEGEGHDAVTEVGEKGGRWGGCLSKARAGRGKRGHGTGDRTPPVGDCGWLPQIRRRVLGARQRGRWRQRGRPRACRCARAGYLQPAPRGCRHCVWLCCCRSDCAKGGAGRRPARSFTLAPSHGPGLQPLIRAPKRDALSATLRRRRLTFPIDPKQQWT